MSSWWSPPVMPRNEDVRGRAMTLEEWANMDEDDEGELVDGFLTEEEVPSHVHERAVTWLVQRVGAWVEAHGGFIFGSGLKFRVGERTGRIPDLSVHLDPSRARGSGGLQRVMADIVVEIVTPRPRDERRDRVEKMTDYARAGVRWYWILDPALGSFEVFELTESRTYARVLAATDGTVSGIPGCESLTIDLDALWSELERAAPMDAAEQE